MAREVELPKARPEFWNQENILGWRNWPRGAQEQAISERWSMWTCQIASISLKRQVSLGDWKQICQGKCWVNLFWPSLFGSGYFKPALLVIPVLHSSRCLISFSGHVTGLIGWLLDQKKLYIHLWRLSLWKMSELHKSIKILPKIPRGDDFLPG